MALTETPEPELGSSAPDFELRGVDGGIWTLDECRGEKGTLVMFICNHCPYVKAILEKIVRDCAELENHGVASVAIMSNDPNENEEDSYENMARVAKQNAFPFPYLIDASQETAHAYGAVCTPDFFGYDQDLKLRYRGRLDAAGRDPEYRGGKRELFDAMVQIAETGTGPEVQFPSMGCSIKWKDDDDWL